MLRALLILPLVLSLPVTAQAQPPRAVDVLSIYRDLNDLCRDPSYDDLHKVTACTVREKVSRLLNGMGWCYGVTGQDAAGMQWHKCTAHEIF